MPLTQQDSLYEHLYPLTTVAGQRFVANFSRHSPDTKRWGFGYKESSTSNSGAIDNGVNEGLKLTTGTAHNDQALYMSFMNGTATDGSDNANGTTIPIKQFESGTANMIFSFKLHSALSGNGNAGGGFAQMGNGDWTGADSAALHQTSTESKFRFLTSNGGGTQNFADTSVNADTNWHTYKLSANVTADPVVAGTSSKLYIDGVLEGEKEGSIGWFSDKVAPKFSIQRNSSASGTASCYMNYCEVWNG